MASIKVFIKTQRTKGEANIRFRLCDGRNLIVFYKSNIKVDIELWDNKRERIKPQKICSEIYRNDIENRIATTKKLIAEVYNTNKDKISNSNDLKKYIEEGVNKASKNKEQTFFDIFDLYLTEKDNKEYSPKELKNFRSLERLLHRYQGFKEITENNKYKLSLNITKEEVEDIADYIRNEYILFDEYPTLYKKLLEEYPLLVNIQRASPKLEQRGENTIIKILGRLKAFFNWAYNKKYTSNRPFEGYEIGSPMYGTPIIITKEERDIIADFDLSKYPRLETQRDIFIFQCYVGCRVSDLTKFTSKNIVGGILEYVPQKTQKTTLKTIEVPLHDKALAIIKRYKDKNRDSLLPYISDQKYNDSIKEIFNICGITRMVTIIDPKTRKPKQVPINEIASSHLARRTFTQILYSQIKDKALVASLTGHSEDSRAFSRYRDINIDIKKDLIEIL